MAPAENPTPRGTCPHCRYRVQLRKDGSIGGHRLYIGKESQGLCYGVGAWPSGTTSRGKK